MERATDWQPRSDIDLVCVVARTLTSREIDQLSRIYGRTIDAVYVTAECLSLGPDTVNSAAVAYSATNLDKYWRNRITLSERMYLATGRPIPQFEIEWMSLGPARLVATVLTRRVVSKSDGGRFAAYRFPGFTEHVERVLGHAS